MSLGKCVALELNSYSGKKVLLPSSGTHIRVLMFVDSVEVERFVVDEKLGAGYTDCADSDWESIHILIRRSPVGCHQVNLDNGILNVSKIFFLHLFQQKEKALLRRNCNYKTECQVNS